MPTPQPDHPERDEDEKLEELAERILHDRGIEGSIHEFLHTRGIDMTMTEVLNLVIDRIDRLRDLSRQSSRPLPPESVHQRLAASGVTFEPFDGDQDPVALSIARYSDLVASSFSTRQAAGKLGVGESRVRQLLNASPPKLYGFKARQSGAWKIPRFQFDDNGLIPGITDVLSALDPGLPPLEVEAWFTAPSPDLEDTNGRPLTPLQWLRSGNPVDTIVDIAQRIG